MINRIRQAGIIGAGGAGFPTHVKLNTQAEYILLNGAECEPLLRVDQQLLRDHAEEILLGFEEARKLVNASKGIVGIKGKHAEVIKSLRKTIEELNLNQLTVGILPDMYPAGDEQVLVYELTGRVVPEASIPAAVGCVVINAETTLNLYRAIEKSEAVTMKYVTVSGDVPNPATVKVPVGTPVLEVLSLSGRTDFTNCRVIDGGPMMGPLLSDLSGYVTKKSKGFIVLPQDHPLVVKKERELRAAIHLNKTACEQCRLCTDLCPRHLLGHSTAPHKMVRALTYGQEAGESVAEALTCCQCNLCEYFSCPAGISPKMANVKYMNELRERGIRFSPTKEAYKVSAMREYRKVPTGRLIARLGLKQYDRPAPLREDASFAPELVCLSLTAHVGAPAKPLVKEGDEVLCGQLIAEVPESSMGACVHASVEGIVESAADGWIKIRRK